MMMILALLACAPETSGGETDTQIEATHTTASGPQIYVWEFSCDEDLPAWAPPAGTIVGMQYLTLLNSATIDRGEELTIESDQPLPSIDGNDPGYNCNTGFMTGGRIVATYLPA